MKATQLLHNLGQSIWLDNITRDLLEKGTLERYIDELSVTGLTSNPSIFNQAIKNSTVYAPAIRKELTEGKSGEAVFFDLALEDLIRAADLFQKELGSILPADGGDCEEVLSQFADAGINVGALAAQLQDEGAKSFVKSWNDLMSLIESKNITLRAAS